MQYKKIMEMFPDFLGIYIYLRNAYLYGGKYKELLEEAKDWIEKGKITEEDLNYIRMMCELRMGRKEAASKYLEQIKCK